MTTPLWTITVVLAACVIGAFGALFLKKGADQISFNFIKLVRNKKLLLGVTAYAVSTVMFIPALKYGDLSILYPFVATSYLWVTLFSKWFLKEEMNSWKWTGIFIILAGITLIGVGA